MTTAHPIKDPRAICSHALAWAESICPAPIEHELCPYSTEQRERIAARPRLKRSIDFAMGRRCARTALARIGMHQEVGVKQNRAPHWPNGVAGSISHSDRLAWASVTSNPGTRSLGVDTESIVDAFTRTQLFHEVLCDREWEQLESLPFDNETKFTLAFSAKESFYKAWASLTGAFFDFHQAEITSASQERMMIRMTESNPNAHLAPLELAVHFYVAQTEVFTLTWMNEGRSSC